MAPTPEEENFTDNYSASLDSDFVSESMLMQLLQENMQMPENSFSVPTVVCGALMGCVAAVGIIGNIFNVCIFSKRSMGSASIGVLLTGLSAVDAMLLLVAAPLFASSAIYVFRPSIRLMTFIAYLTAYAYPCASILQTTSVWLMMVATMDRWFGVCRPFLARSVCTRSRAKIMVALALLVSLAYNACRLWEYQLTSLGGGAATVALPRLRQDKLYMRIYVHWMYFIFIFAIPFIVLSFVNGMVVLTIQKAKRDRRNLTRQQRKEHSTAALMVIVAFVYITCNSLAFVLNAMELWGASGVHDVELPADESPFQAPGNKSDFLSANFLSNQSDTLDSGSSRTTQRHSNFFYFLIDLNNLLVMIHCSVNFLIYYAFSQRFRAHAHEYILGIPLKRHSVDGDGSDSHNSSRVRQGSNADSIKLTQRSFRSVVSAPNRRLVTYLSGSTTQSFNETNSTYLSRLGSSAKQSVDHQSSRKPFFSASPRSDTCI